MADPRLRSDSDYAGFDHAAADLRPLGEFENLKNLRFSDYLLALFRFKFSGEGVGDILEQFVDDAVEADFDMLLLGQVVDARIDPDVESDDDRIGRRRERYVVFGDRTDRVGDHFRLDLLRRKLIERLRDGFAGTLYIGLDDDVQRVATFRIELAEEILRGCNRTGGKHVALSAIRRSDSARAAFSDSKISRRSPASGTPLMPTTLTGMLGPADFTRSPLSLINVRTLP